VKVVFEAENSALDCVLSDTGAVAFALDTELDRYIAVIIQCESFYDTGLAL